MEINFFLDNQQITFEKLTTEIATEVELSEDDDDRSVKAMSDDIVLAVIDEAVQGGEDGSGSCNDNIVDNALQGDHGDD